MVNIGGRLALEHNLNQTFFAALIVNVGYAVSLASQSENNQTQESAISSSILSGKEAIDKHNKKSNETKATLVKVKGLSAMQIMPGVYLGAKISDSLSLALCMQFADDFVTLKTDVCKADCPTLKFDRYGIAPSAHIIYHINRYIDATLAIAAKLWMKDGAIDHTAEAKGDSKENHMVSFIPENGVSGFAILTLSARI